MRIYFATNRQPLPDAQSTAGFGDSISDQGVADLRFGWADFPDDGGDSYTLHVAAENLTTAAAALNVGDRSGQRLGSAEVFEAVRLEMLTQKQDCVVSIHGFDYTFDDALKRTAELKRWYCAVPMTWFLFSWPSEGHMKLEKSYYSDRTAVRASGEALGRGLLKLSDYLHGTRPEDYCGQSLHIVAHSMGNYALRWAIQTVKANTVALRRIFEQVLLFAADEDDDAFEFDYKLQPLPDLARRITVYCNPDDRALMVSDLTKGNPDRLGAGGPRNARALPDKVSIVNVEGVESLRDDPTGHQYYRTIPAVRDDALAVFAGQPSNTIKARTYLPETRSYRLKPTRGG